MPPTRPADISPLTVVLSRVDAVTYGAPARDTIGTGFPSVDKALGGGFRRGDLVVLGGDVGSGKSALALAFSVRAMQGPHPHVTFLTGEMAPERVLERLLAIEGRARVDDLRQGRLDELARANVGAAAVRVRRVVPEIRRLRPGGVSAVASVLEELPETALLVVDGLQMLAEGRRDLAEEAAAAVRDLKSLAVEREIVILLTAQLPHLTARPDRRPTLDDFGGLGAVKHHADVVLALYREEMYSAARDIEGATELLVRKNRNGHTGYVDLYFYSQWMRFEDMLDPDR
jgi:replicative DNA helicase